MTTRTTDVSATSDTVARIRRRLALHRRPISAALAFVAVLFGLAAVSADPSTSDALPAVVSGPPAAAPSDGQLVFPLRLSDPAVTAMLAPGDVVDVMVADQHGSARLVAADLIVTTVPDAQDSRPWSDGDGLVMVAATEDEALALAGATARGPVTVAVHP